MSDLIPYLGAKRSRGTLLQILGQMSRHDLFIESHLGTGAVSNAKPPALRDLGFDVDAQTLATFNYEAHIEVRNACFHEFLKSDEFGWLCLQYGKVLIYCDPPYVMTTRTSSKRYRHEYDEAKHIEILTLLKRLPDNVDVIISGYPSPLYDDELAGWRTHEFQAMTRGGVRTEKLWMNYPPSPPFWHTQAGANAEDRRRIKRLAARWRANFNSRTLGEQMAILAAIAAEDDD